MSIFCNNETEYCECGELAEYSCDHPGCDRLMCVDCLPDMGDECPNEFCWEHVDLLEAVDGPE